MADAEQVTAPAEGETEVFSKDHQSYFTKSAERVNSTLHAAFCKACQAHGESLDDNRTCLWQARDCIRHLARCPHVSAAVRAHFKEEARLLNARLSSKKRSFPEAFTKPEDAQQDQFTDSHQVTISLDDLGNTETVTDNIAGLPAVGAAAVIASLQAQLQVHSNALARLQPLLDRHDRLACQAVVMTATSKLDGLIQVPASPVPQSSLAQDVAGLAKSRLQDLQETKQGSGSHARTCSNGGPRCISHDFTQQEMADAINRRQGSDVLAYQRLFQFAFSG